MSVTPSSPESRKLKGKLGSALRHHPENAAEIAAYRQQLAASTIHDHVAALVAAAPPLTNEQIDRITGLLRAGVK